MAPHFDKANEIYFRLGIIYKQQNKFPQSLEVKSVNQLQLYCDANSHSASGGLPRILPIR